MLAYYFLDQERDYRQQQTDCHITIGDAWRQIQRTHWRHFIDWIHLQFRFGYEPTDLYHELTGASI